MKNIFLSLFAVFCISSATKPLHAQWTQTNGPFNKVYALAVSGTNLFAGGDAGGVSRYNGTSWTPVSIGLTNSQVWALAVSDTNLFAGTLGGGVFLSTNNGTSWGAANTGLPPNAYVNVFAVSGTNLFAGTSYVDGVFLSTNNGTSWTAASTGLPGNPYVLGLAVSGTNLFAGISGVGVGVFRSTNNGTSWTASSAGLSYTSVLSVAISDTNVFAGTLAGGVFHSTNNGSNWAEVYSGLTYVNGQALVVSDTTLYIGTPNGVFLSTLKGTNWTGASASLTYTDVRALKVSGTNLFAGTYGGGVWRRPLSEMITSAETPSTNLPAHFSLQQNYPNPFNPATTISFSLPSKSFVILKVFDALGREVSILLENELSPGTYARQWNARDLPTGVYYYRLQAGSFTETRKLLLLR